MIVDDLILGGGCAGLSLATRLSSSTRRRIAVVEPRTEFRRDRTWCFWNVHRHPFEHCVDHSWARWAVRYRDEAVVHADSSYRYCEIPADRFYDTALSGLQRDENTALLLGTRAETVREEDGRVRVETDRGTLWASRVFDSRPPPRSANANPAGMLQHFLGARVETATPCFDPGTVTLMDFDVGQERGIHFVYVLPFGRREALVESTLLSAEPEPRAFYLAAIRGYLERRFGAGDARLQEVERGVIPMDPRPAAARPDRRIYRIGTGGGLVKPSTGYAFLAIQRWSSAFSRALLVRDLPRPPRPRGRGANMLDAIFLAYLRRHPDRAPGVFMRLFAGVGADALVRFLSDCASAREQLRVMRALPTADFLPLAPHAVDAWATG